MTRKVFFSFHYARDAWRVSQVRNSNVVASTVQRTQFLDHASWQSIERSGEAAIKRWIDSQMEGSTVTCILIGRMTNERQWVHYEIERSIERKNAILGIYIHNLRNQYGEVDLPGFNPMARHKIRGKDLDLIAPVYDWDLNRGYANFGNWIEAAIDAFKAINHFRGS
jgi:hypothetical protein